MCWQQDLFQIQPSDARKMEIGCILAHTPLQAPVEKPRVFPVTSIPSRMPQNWAFATRNAFAVNEEKSVFLVDCPRSKQGDFIQCNFLAELKNRRSLSSKHDSGIKRHPEKPHAVVMMSEPPDKKKLLRDRHPICDPCVDGTFTIR